MSKKLIQLQEERNTLITQARAILEKSESEKRDNTSEENVHYDKLMADQQKIADSIDREKRMIAAEREIATTEFEKDKRSDDQSGNGNPLSSKEYRAAFNKVMSHGSQSLNADESRALSAGAGTEGGYLVMPQQMVSELLKNVDDQVLIRSLARVFSLPNAASLGVPTLAADPSDAAWTAELATGSADSAMSFGKRELTPSPLAKRILVSNKLLRAAPNSESIVMDRLAYKYAISQEKAFLTGSGANQPLGVFTASANGVSTGRDVSSGNTTTAFTIDGLINAKYSLKAQYQRTAQWIFHRDAVKMLAKLKDGEGQYLWQPAKTQSDPDMVLGRPILISEYAPNTFATGLYVGLLGDFSFYWIADAMNMQIQRLIELYAESNQTGFIGRIETDGMPVLEEAFARVKLA